MTEPRRLGESGEPIPKPEPRKRLKAREKRRERAVVQDVRPQVAGRDGYCRLYWFDAATRRLLWELFGPCGGTSEWAHFGEHKRFKTRGQDPEERHTRPGSLMLCETHHDDYDENRLVIDALTERECDGPLRFKRGGRSWEEPG